VVKEISLSDQPPSNGLAQSRGTSLSLFYLGGLACAVCLHIAGKLQLPARGLVLVLAIIGAVCAIWGLLRFLHTTDERERQINYRALTLAFVGTLIFSLAVGFLQRFGFHSVSWFGIPALMVILWSVGLILFSWRYR
jgi:uncharacterized membrane protein